VELLKRSSNVKLGYLSSHPFAKLYSLTDGRMFLPSPGFTNKKLSLEVPTHLGILCVERA
jgi:hypothetical protein